MTGTPEDAEAAYEEWRELTKQNLVHPDLWPVEQNAFLAGFAARPSVTVDEITELLVVHAGWHTKYDPDVDEHWDICECGTRIAPSITLSQETERLFTRHQASVIVAHITGEGGRND